MKPVWQIGNILSFVFALVANYIVGTQQLNLPSINEISDKYATLLTPATYAFSIWSLIYLLLIVFVVYQARDLFKPDKENDVPQKVGPYFIIASICNGLWTYFFVQEWVALSVLLLLLLTTSLYTIMWKLDIAVVSTKKSAIACVWWPILLYTGWVTVATVVNIASWVDSLGFTLSSTVSILILAALVIGLLWLLIERNARELLLASAWGIIAIGVRQIQLEQSTALATTSFAVGVLLVVSVMVHAYKNRASNQFFKKITDS